MVARQRRIPSATGGISKRFALRLRAVAKAARVERRPVRAVVLARVVADAVIGFGVVEDRKKQGRGFDHLANFRGHAAGIVDRPKKIKQAVLLHQRLAGGQQIVAVLGDAAAIGDVVAEKQRNLVVGLGDAGPRRPDATGLRRTGAAGDQARAGRAVEVRIFGRGICTKRRHRAHHEHRALAAIVVAVQGLHRHIERL